MRKYNLFNLFDHLFLERQVNSFNPHEAIASGSFRPGNLHYRIKASKSLVTRTSIN